MVSLTLTGDIRAPSEVTHSRKEEYFNTEYLFEEVQASERVKGEAAVFWGGGLRTGNLIC